MENFIVEPVNDSRSIYRQGDYDQAGLAIAARRVFFKPLFGLFNQEKLIPLRYCPIQIELDLVNRFFDATVMRDVYASGLWNISDIQCKCDLLTLDNTLDNEYASHLLSGKSLPNIFATWSHTNQSTGNDLNKPVQTFIEHYLVLNLYLSLLILLIVCNIRKRTVFYHPISVKLNDGYDIEDEHSFQVQIGSKFMTEYPLSSVTETLYQLGKPWSSPSYLWKVVPFSSIYYWNMDAEKISGAGFTCLSTKPGDQITLNLKNCDAEGWPGSVPTRMYCALHSDCVLNVQDSGVQVLD